MNLNNAFSFNQTIGTNYSVDIENPKRTLVRMDHPDEKSAPVFQMIFVLKGKLSLMKKDNLQVFAEIENQRHNLCRIPTSQTLMSFEQPDDQIFCINLSHEYISRFLPADHKIYKMLMSGLKKKEGVLLSEVNMPVSPEISSILQRLGQIQTGELGDQLILESKIIELLALQITQYEQLQSSKTTLLLKAEELKKMEQAREILIQHEGDRISLRSLAHLVGTNECYLKRNFKAAFGNTVYAYLNQYKMEQAKEMLIEKGMTITQVAAKTGYKHATHFTNAFKKYFGYLPNKLKSSKLSLLVFADDLFMIFENMCFM